MCEVAVREGDDGWYAGRHSLVSELKCPGMVCERHDTQECVGRMSTTTASEKGQRPGSGRSCFEYRAGFAQQRARGSGRAAHEAAACSAAQVKPGP